MATEQELLQSISFLEHLPLDAHWFCPRTSRQLECDQIEIKQEEPEIEHPSANSLESRLDAFRNYLYIYSYDGDDSYRRLLESHIERNLARCDACIIGYYQAKHRWTDNVRRQHQDDEEVTTVVNAMNDCDINRIAQRLDTVAKSCRPDVVEDDPKGSEMTARRAILDTLSCEAFVLDSTRMRQHFELPFNYYSEAPSLRVDYLLPGSTALLFDPDPGRMQWAFSNWTGLPSKLTQEEFDFAVRGPLARTLNQWSNFIPETDAIGRLWKGIGVIFERLDSNLITHSLRAMEVQKGVFTLSFEHLAYDAPGFQQLLQTLKRFLELAPKDYWESMGATPPQIIIESIFNNRQYGRILRKSREFIDAQVLPDLLDWIRPFVASLELGHQSKACRTLTSYLFDRLQADDLPSEARIACFATGLKVIKRTSLNCNKEHPKLSQVGRVNAAELLEVSSTYIQRILAITALPSEDPWHERCCDLSFDVVELALTLECKCLRTDQEVLRDEEDIGPETCEYGAAMWESIVQHLNQQNIPLARAALSGMNGLTGLEKFEIKKDVVHKTYKCKFNVRLGHFTHLACLMLERINDFDPTDLDKLFHHPTTATALVASLFSPDASTYEAGVNLMKSISLESARKEAIRHVLTPFFEVTLDSLSRSLRRIAQTRSYASCPRMLKTCSDVLDILCDSQTGLLRTKSLQYRQEIRALENFWEHQWMALTVIYQMTEPWSRVPVDDPEVMKEFVRDTMDLSERIFDQYSIFASAIDSAVLIKDEEGLESASKGAAAENLLAPPSRTMEEIVRWLRLRDTYLAGMSVKLTNKVLDRLTEKGIKIAKEPSDFVELVLRGGTQGRTNLSPQQKAELARALEANLGRVVEPAKADHESRSVRSTAHTKVKREAKNGTIDLDLWRSKSESKAKVIEIPDDDSFEDSDILDPDILALSQSVEMTKKLGIGTSSKPYRNSQDQPTARSIPSHKALEARKADEKRLANSKAFKEKRKKDVEARRRRDAEQAALLRKNAAGKSVENNSRLGSLGIQGKEHAPKGTGVMVSTDSESDSGDEVDRALFGDTKATHVSKAVREYQNNRLMQTTERIPVKKMQKNRSVKDMRARLAPDLTALHKIILSWEYFHDGAFPPRSDRDDYSLVSGTFRTPSDYQSTFEPLLILEAWQGFLKSKEDGSFKCFNIKVANRLTVDSFVEVSTTIPISEGKELGISEADILLMSKAQSPTMEPQLPHCLARVYKINRKKATMDISYRVNVDNGLLGAMVPNATLYGVKILSLTPLEREYGALLGLKYMDLCEEIIKAKPSPLLDYSDSQLKPLVSLYRVNTAQAKAIKSAIDNDAFTLIQGPPGSGKTKTIVAIVGALLSGQFGDKGTAISRPQADFSSARRNVNAVAPKKLLVCAPSNAAVDELVMRFKQGVRTTSGDFQKPSIIRLGRSDAINANVLDVTLDELVNARLNMLKPKENSGAEDIHQIMMAHKSTCDDINTLRATLDGLKASGKSPSPEQQREFEILKRKKQQLSNKIDAARDSGDMVARDAEINRRKIQQEILEGAHVICATLSGSGHEMFQNLNIEFETVIIDEAAQSIELSALIPLKYGCTKCILVGDPKQLPPTVLSREAARFQYEQSLFVRMQNKHAQDVHLLDTQYRMHPEISMFPSKEFYDGRLLDGEGMLELRAKPWHQSEILGPYRFFDVQGVQKSAPSGHSLINIAEIEMALSLFARLTTDCTGYDFKGMVGIITPYKSQLRELRARFSQKYGESILSTVEFNTTDAFQGRECEVIIFSCVRASATSGIGFLSDIRRMNVGITRAKSSLWVLGNSRSLMQGDFWNRLIEDAKRRDRFSGAEVLERLRKPLLKIDSRSLSTNGGSSIERFPTVEEDVEMVDAPAVSALHDTSASEDRIANSYASSDVSAKSIHAEQATSARSSDESASSAFMPSGGGNGLNQQSNCGLCGSSLHPTFACSNIEARSMSTMKCFRCGGLDHRRDACTAERCLECGEFGHSAQVCTSSYTLRKSEKERVRHSEASHKLFAQRSQETQRRKQLGDHAKEAPIVRTTSITPPPKSSKTDLKHLPQKSHKRRRDSSPPLSAPRGPKASKLKHHKAGAHSNHVGQVEDVTPGASAQRQSLPLRSPTIGSNNTGISSSHHDTAGQESKNVPNPKPQSNPTQDNSIRRPAPNTYASGIDPPSNDTGPPSLPNKPQVKPSIKKRKDANPFLIPNRKPR